MTDFDILAEPRVVLGKAAMRRMRREGRVPGIVYGAGRDPMPVTVHENTLRKQMENEAFFSHVITVKVAGGQDEQAVVKALQRHPATSRVLHLDLLRVSATQKLTLTVPLRFEGESASPGARLGGIFSHLVTEVEVSCLPGNLPEHIVVDVGRLELGDSIHLSQVPVPEGVEMTALAHGNDLSVVSVALMRTDEESAPEADDVPGDGPESTEGPREQ